MDFFASQDRARRQTRLLVAYFAGAVVLIVLALNGVAIVAMNLVSAGQRHAREPDFGRPVYYPNQPGASRESGISTPAVLGCVTLAALALIAGGSVYKTAQLAGGGKSVAELMRAVPVPPATADPGQRVLRNVVEEMAIASGIPVPAVYVLASEAGINAFAAGFTPRDAIICVTRGCVEQLSRDELQGVIAHEFSHILNGDMRLNLRVVGVLHGILLLGLVGYGILRSVGTTGSSSRDDDDKTGLFLLVVGGLVTAIGFVGLFFGRLIQAAVCRQREFLADASAVQFTRNPEGLAGALKKLGAYSGRSKIRNHDAEQIAHFFFGSSLGIEWGWFATHPPISQRVRAIDPSWDGTFPPPDGPTTRDRYAGRTAGEDTREPAVLRAISVLGSIGNTMPRHIRWASDLLGSIPPTINEAARDPFSARALVFALLLSEDETVCDKQRSGLAQATDAATAGATDRLVQPVRELGAPARRVLLDLAVPALRHLSGPQCQEFRRAVRMLVEADGRVSLFEYMLYKVLDHSIPAAGGAEPTVEFVAVKAILDDAGVLLSALARADGKDAASAQAAFRVGATRLDFPQLQMLPAVDLRAVDAALNRLVRASPPVKRRVVDACAHCAAVDGMISTEESELLRTLVIVLGCPMPPILAGPAGVAV